MKKLLSVIVLSIMLFSCAIDNTVKEYTFQVEYFNGAIDTIKYNRWGKNLFFLYNGDLTAYLGGRSTNKTIVSGIRKFKVLSIINTKSGENIPIQE